MSNENGPLLAHLTDGRVSVLLTTNGGMPCVAHWGAPLGEVDAGLLLALERPVPRGGLDIDPQLGLIAESSVGWAGQPGLEGHRPDGRDFAPQLVSQSSEVDERRARFLLADESAALSMQVTVELRAGGVVTIDVSVSNDGTTDYMLDACRATLPVPSQAQELLTVGGRWTNEFGQTRTPWNGNCLTVDNRRGRTSHERLGAVFAGTTAYSAKDDTPR